MAGRPEVLFPLFGQLTTLDGIGPKLAAALEVSRLFLLLAGSASAGSSCSASAASTFSASAFAFLAAARRCFPVSGSGCE